MSSPILITMRSFFTFSVACIFWLAFSAVANAGSLTQQVSMHWKENVSEKGQTATFSAPGIGRAEITCRENRTWIIVYPTNRLRETNMWTSKYERKAGKWSASVKNARVYRYAHVGDVSGGGTGPSAREGFNQVWPVESSSNGYMYGLLSQKSPRNQSGSQSMPPATSFYLTWSWKNFGTDDAECHISATIRTRANVTKNDVRKQTKIIKIGSARYQIGRVISWNTRSIDDMDLTWRFGGENQITQKQLIIDGIGTAQIDCDPILRKISFVLTPLSSSSGIYVTQVQGEGFESETQWQENFDVQTGQIGPIMLPQNGMMRLGIQVDTHKAQVAISSLAKFNDPSGHKNFCETSMQVF